MLQSQPGSDDQLLMDRLVNDKDPRAFEVLYIKYYPRLRCHIARCLGSAGDAEDLTQCVFVRLWETRARYEKSGSVEAYLFTVANNAIAQYGRHRKRQRRHIPIGSITNHAADRSVHRDDGPTDQTPRHQPYDILADKRIQISVKARDALRLRFIDGLSTAQAARVVGCSKAAFYSRLERALKALKGWMSQEEAK